MRGRRRPYLVATTGGHLAELVELRHRLPLDEPPRWITFDNEQSRSLLADEDVVHLPHVDPRDVVALARATRRAWSHYREVPPGLVVSTGSGIALAALPLAAALGGDCHYVESAARLDRLSMTGRLLERTPGVRIWTQHAALATPRRPVLASVFDGFAPGPVRSAATPFRIVVTVGMMRGYEFRRLLERLVEVVPRDAASIFWQTGATPVDDLPIDGVERVPSTYLADEMAQADVVVAHGGIGSSLMALGAGRCPVLVPRRAEAGENVDDHQVEIAADLEERGLAVVTDADRLGWEHLAEAASRSVIRRSATPLDLRS